MTFYYEGGFQLPQVTRQDADYGLFPEPLEALTVDVIAQMQRDLARMDYEYAECSRQFHAELDAREAQAWGPSLFERVAA